MLRPFDPNSAEHVLDDVLWRAGLRNLDELPGRHRSRRFATALASGLHGVANRLERGHSQRRGV